MTDDLPPDLLARAREVCGCPSDWDDRAPIAGLCNVLARFAQDWARDRVDDDRARILAGVREMFTEKP